MKRAHQFLEIAKEQMKRPEGSVTFEFNSDDLTNDKVQGGKIFEIVAGGHVFILERTNDLKINFIYSSHGAGTKIASIDLRIMPRLKKAFFCLTWSPLKITLAIGPRDLENGEIVFAEGVKAKFQVRVGADGSVFFIGDENVEVMDVSINQGGEEVLSSSAIEAWNNIKTSLEILGKGESDQGYLFECVVTNLSLSILVTGFESYLKKRFTELEDEGIKPNFDELVNSFLSKKEKENSQLEVIKEEASNQNISLLKYLVKKRIINFQNFDDIKKAYKKAYTLTLESAQINSNLIDPIKRFLIYRHRIIHVSPILGILNQNNVPPEEPVFPNKKLKEDALNTFDSFINLFHNASLKLQRKD